MKTDVVIVGGGPGGNATALFLAQEGINSIIVEKSPFPRFHIGESMTGECGNIVRLLGFEEEMMEKKHPVKHGVRVYGPGGKNSFWVPVKRRTEDGELADSTTWQVRRSDFDKMLYDKVNDMGLQVLQGQATKPLLNEDGSVRGVLVRTAEGNLEEIESKVLVDASGLGTFLGKSGVTSEKERGNYDNQVAIFSHLKNTNRDEQDNTLIFYKDRNHWAWFIPIDPETVSVGVVVPSEHFAEQKTSKEDFYNQQLETLNPELTMRVLGGSLVEEVRAISNYSYHIKEFTGKGYLCVGDSHRFVDPIFSFGLHFAITEAKMASDSIVSYLNGETSDSENPFLDYQKLADQGQDVIQDLIDCFWEQPLAFAFIVHTRYTEDIIDIFAGRIYSEDPSPGLQAVRKVLAHHAEAVPQ